MLNIEKVENFSGVSLNLKGMIEPLRKGNWHELNYSVGGDAPKNFIALYEYEEDSETRKIKAKTWPKYIAKVGQKWYPIESINEYLFNQIGEVLELKMAYSKLIMAGDQLRFLSRYFLKKNEILVHGAEIFYGYLSDKAFVEEIERKELARKFFTFQFAEASIKNMFPEDSEQILMDFVKMLVFDAAIGNNDRHFYNWGVVKHVGNKKTPIFAPIYDTARGLFWNDSESKIKTWYEHPRLIDERIKKYAEGSKPKTGWEGLEDLNHFDLVCRIFSADSRYKVICKQVISEQNQIKVLSFIDSKFSQFYSPQRMELIERCLIYRFQRLRRDCN
jgi:hypothetical protein